MASQNSLEAQKKQIHKIFCKCYKMKEAVSLYRLQRNLFSSDLLKKANKNEASK